MLATGMTASAMEHTIWEQFLEQEAVSTVKVLMKANEAGIPIFTVSSKNIDQVLPQLQVSEYVKTDIQNAVNRGHIVTIPKKTHYDSKMRLCLPKIKFQRGAEFALHGQNFMLT